MGSVLASLIECATCDISASVRFVNSFLIPSKSSSPLAYFSTNAISLIEVSAWKTGSSNSARVYSSRCVGSFSYVARTLLRLSSSSVSA